MTDVRPGAEESKWWFENTNNPNGPIRIYDNSGKLVAKCIRQELVAMTIVRAINAYPLLAEALDLLNKIRTELADYCPKHVGESEWHGVGPLPQPCRDCAIDALLARAGRKGGA